MQKYNLFEVKDREYQDLLSIQINNGGFIKEHTIGNRKKLYVHEKLIATMANSSNLDIGELSKQQFTSFLGQFNRHLYAKLSMDVKLLDINVQFKGQARDKNHIFWDSLNVGAFFYNVDLSSAYWQIAHRLGYISTELFEKYKDNDTYKHAKRYCISFLARENKCTYIVNNHVYDIKCDMSIMKKVYDNIRYELYTCIQQSIQGVNDWIEYNIDGVSVMAYDLDLIKSRFKALGLYFKVTQCRKMSSTEYKYGSKLRKFKNK